MVPQDDRRASDDLGATIRTTRMRKPSEHAPNEHRLPRNIAIDGDRLWATIMETAQIGATPKGGICRLTLTDLDRQVRDWFRAVVRGRRLHRVASTTWATCSPAGPGRDQSLAADRHRQPSRHPADRRQVRRHHRRAGRAGSAAHAERPGLRDQRADRGDQLDQRGRLALRPGDAVLRACSPACSTPPTPMRARIARASGSATNWTASAIKGEMPVRLARARRAFRTAYRAGADPGSRGEDHRRRHRRAGHALVSR